MATPANAWTSIILTNDGVVSRLDGIEAIRPYLGPLNTLNELGIVLLDAGYADGAGDARVAVGNDGSSEWLAARGHGCLPYRVDSIRVRITADGVITELPGSTIRFCMPDSCAGRNPLGLARTAGYRTRSAVAARLASMHAMERASVTAFEELAASLVLHGAPTSLVRAARRAADDEREHGAILARLTRRYEGRVGRVHVAKTRETSLVDLALANAVDGCVHEAFAVCVAAHQAKASADAAVRSASARIARDEARHAALAHRVHAFCLARLSATDARRVESARRDGLASLAREVRGEEDASVASALGLPTPDAAKAMASRFATAMGG